MDKQLVFKRFALLHKQARAPQRDSAVISVDSHKTKNIVRKETQRPKVYIVGAKDLGGSTEYGNQTSRWESAVG